MPACPFLHLYSFVDQDVCVLIIVMLCVIVIVIVTGAMCQRKYKSPVERTQFDHFCIGAS